MKVAKAILAAVGLVVTTASGALADNVFDFNEIGTLVTQVLVGTASVWGVWRVPNTENNGNVTINVDPADPNFYRDA